MTVGLLDLTLLLAVAGAGYLAARLIVFPVLAKAARRTDSAWDDIITDRRIQSRAALLIPLVVVRVGLPLITETSTAAARSAADLTGRVLEALVVVVALLTVGAFLNALDRTYMEMAGSADRPIKGYLQATLVFLWLFGVIVIIARLADQPVGALLAGLGAVSAVLLLVFRDTLLSLSASVQLSNSDMLRLGDWIEVPDQSANGVVEDVALLTIKVRNFDNTVTTIPTYNLISRSFKNWRGMIDSGARRMMRSLNLDAGSVRTLAEDEVERWIEKPLVGHHVLQRRDVIREWNSQAGRLPRQLTNIGVFRAYAEAYLRAHPRIDQERPLMVRQLDPQPDGVPMQLYAFIDTVVWEEYESIQSDIFDHLLATIGEFDLRIHQSPTGADIASLRGAD